MAARAGHDDVVAWLIEAGADPDAIVPDDETPLINAAREGHLQTVQYLVEHGADVNLGVTADFGEWRSPLNQASDEAVRSYLTRHRSEEHTSELQSLMRISYAVFCLKQKSEQLKQQLTK